MKNEKMQMALKERENQSREIRKTIHASKGMDRWAAWQEKRSYGADTRHILLAYGMARGLPYLACEPKCGEDNQPSASAIQAWAAEHGVLLTQEAIKAWLKCEAAAVATSAAA